MAISTPLARRFIFGRLPQMLAIASLGLLGVTCSAQAGIDIRAPFTHVGVDRHDGINVAAPFTRVGVDRERGINVAAPFTRVKVGGQRYHDDRRDDHRGRSYDRRDYYRHDHDRRDRGFFGRWQAQASAIAPGTRPAWSI